MSSVQELYEKECEMALQDKIQEETSERKNALEAYIYSLRNKLCDRLAEYVTSEEKADLNQKLEAAEVIRNPQKKWFLSYFYPMARKAFHRHPSQC